MAKICLITHETHVPLKHTEKCLETKQILNPKLSVTDALCIR